MKAIIRFSEKYLLDYLDAMSLHLYDKSGGYLLNAAARLCKFIGEQVDIHNRIEATVVFGPVSDHTPNLSIQYGGGTGAGYDRALMEVTVREILMSVDLVRAAMDEGDITWDERVNG